MRQKAHKKQLSLINHIDLTRLRSEKEKIITNPFEENWKKAIVMEELLNLYEPHQAGIAPPTNLNKQIYNNWNTSVSTPFDESQPWEENQDKQVSKYHNMVEGINRWEQNYQGNHINNVLNKLTKGKVSQKKCNPQRTRQQGKVNKINHRKENSSTFDKLNKCGEASPVFQKKKLEIAQLKEKATLQFGVVFNKESSASKAKADLTDYQQRERQIFHKFTRTIKHSRASSMEMGPEQFRESLPECLQKIDLRALARLPDRVVMRCASQKDRIRRRYIRLN